MQRHRLPTRPLRISSSLGSGFAASYTGNRAISTGSTGASATVQVGRDAPYDMWINYTGRTSGGANTEKLTRSLIAAIGGSV